MSSAATVVIHSVRLISSGLDRPAAVKIIDEFLDHFSGHHQHSLSTKRSAQPTGVTLGRRCLHEFCAECQFRSLPPRDSDYWICCFCNGLNLYNPAKRRARLYEELRQGQQSTDEEG